LLEPTGVVRGEVLEDVVRPVAVQRGAEKSRRLHRFKVDTILETAKLLEERNEERKEERKEEEEQG
jgi:hypothetical protein